MKYQERFAGRLTEEETATLATAIGEARSYVTHANAEVRTGDPRWAAHKLECAIKRLTELRDLMERLAQGEPGGDLDAGAPVAAEDRFAEPSRRCEPRAEACVSA